MSNQIESLGINNNMNGTGYRPQNGKKMEQLLYVDALSEKKCFSLTSSPVLIGRGNECDIVVSDKRVSRKHTRLRKKGSRWYVEDLGSTNGTLVNTAKIDNCRLNPDDVISIGSVVFHYKHTEDKPAEPSCVIKGDALTQIMSPASISTADNGGEIKNRLAVFLDIADAIDELDSMDDMIVHFEQAMVKLFQPDFLMITCGNIQSCQVLNGDNEPDSMAIFAKDANLMIRRATENSEALIFDLPPNTADSSKQESIRTHIQSAICVPIFERDTVKGSLYVDRRGGNGSEFKRDDLRFLIVLSRLISSAAITSRRFSQISVENRILASRKGKTNRIVGSSDWCKNIISLIQNKIGPVNSTVLLTGETGTGKTWLAESIHRASKRCSGPFVSVNCAAIPKDLIESELFGHEKGAFSGASNKKIGFIEAAVKGTLFLDEVGELDSGSQSKLLSVLQEKKLVRVGSIKPIDVDIRIVAATNKILKEEVAAGRFRSDLFYRLNVVQLHVPPLRERKEDIEPLASHLLNVVCQEIGKQVDHIEGDILQALVQYNWPGNIRELSNAIERAVIFSDDGILSINDFPMEIKACHNKAGSLRNVEDSDDLEERASIVEALRAAGGNKRQAAKKLGWYPQKFYAKLKRHGLIETK